MRTCLRQSAVPVRDLTGGKVALTDKTLDKQVHAEQSEEGKVSSVSRTLLVVKWQLLGASTRG